MGTLPASLLPEVAITRVAVDCPERNSLRSLCSRRWLKGLVNGTTRAKELNDEFPAFVIPKHGAMLADAQSSESGQATTKGANIAFLPLVHVVDRPPDVSLDARVQLLERGNDLVREFHSGISAASK